MPDRRQTIQWLAAAVLLGPQMASASRPLGGKKELQEPFRFRNATILDATGRVYKNWGGEIIDGRLFLSKDANTGFDLAGKWLVPNFVDAGCTVGMFEVGLESGTHDHSEGKGSERPQLRAVDGYNPLSEVVPTVRANGVGTAVLHPSVNRLVAGLASTVHLSGTSRSEALIEAKAAMCIGLGKAGKGNDGPSTRMGIALRLRELLAEMSKTPSEDSAWWKKKEAPPDAKGAEALWRDVADGKLPLIFSAQRADDVELALDLIEEFTVSGMILGGAEAWVHAARIGALDVPVLLGPVTVQPSSFEHLHARYDNARLLHDAGVRLAFRSGGNHTSRQLPTEVAVAVAHGLPFSAAIRGLCLTPSELFSVSPGFVVEGFEASLANCFVCDGDPLQPRNNISRMWIRGDEVDLRTRQTELYEEYKVLD